MPGRERSSRHRQDRSRDAGQAGHALRDRDPRIGGPGGVWTNEPRRAPIADGSQRRPAKAARGSAVMTASENLKKGREMRRQLMGDALVARMAETTYDGHPPVRKRTEERSAENERASSRRSR